MICPNPDCPDVKRTGNPGQYKQGTSVCPKCGTTLIPGELQWRASPSTTTEWIRYDELVPVMEINNTTLIPIVKSLLDPTGIRYFIKNERTHDLVGYPRFSSGGYNQWWQPEVLVESAMAEDIHALLQEPLDSAGENGTDGQTTLWSMRFPSRLTLLGLWLIFGPPLAGASAVFVFGPRWGLSAMPNLLIGGACVLMLVRLLWIVTLRFYARERDPQDENDV